MVVADTDSVLATIEAIHAAGLDPAAWSAALSSMARLFNAGGATVESYDGQTGRLLSLHAWGIPPAEQLDYFEHYAALNPRAAYGMRQTSEELLWDYKILDEGQMDRDAYYSELLPRTGFRYFLSGVISRTPRAVSVTTLQRTVGQGHVDNAEIALMRRMLPHLRQAVDVAGRLNGHLMAQSSLAEAVDWLADGVALVGGGGELLHANRALREMVEEGDGIRIGGTVEFMSPAAAELFSRALSSIAARSGASAEFTAERSGGPPYVVAVRALGRPRDPGLQVQPAAIVFVHDPLRPGSMSAAVLRDAFGLTRAEADLALGLRSGASPTGYARERNLSLNTVYTHLRRLKEKTGATRLSALIGRLNELHLPLR